MPHRYSTALSHIVLAGTGVYCLVQIKDSQIHLPHVTFGIITVNSLIGVWRWGNPSYGDDVDGVYKLTSYMQLMFALPCIATHEWLSLGYNPYLSWALTVIPVCIFTQYLIDSSNSNDKVENIFFPVEVIALGVVSLLAENYWGVAAAVSYAIDHFIVLKQGESLENIPAQDLYNYGLCFFTYFALRTIMG